MSLSSRQRCDERAVITILLCRTSDGAFSAVARATPLQTEELAMAIPHKAIPESRFDQFYARSGRAAGRLTRETSDRPRGHVL